MDGQDSDGPVDGGIILLMLVMTRLNSMMNLGLYSAPIWRPPISERHLSVTLRNSGTSRNCSRDQRSAGARGASESGRQGRTRVMRWSMTGVSKM